MFIVILIGPKYYIFALLMCAWPCIMYYVYQRHVSSCLQKPYARKSGVFPTLQMKELKLERLREIQLVSGRAQI